MKQQQVAQKEQKAKQNARQRSAKPQAAAQVSEHPHLQAQGMMGNHAVLRRCGSDVIQARFRVGSPKDSEELRKGNSTSSGTPAQLQGDISEAENHTSMPSRLKARLEALSGIDLSGVRVHHNSSKPAELNALAYTQGHDIHVGPGQEKHLPHEGWHAVQQMQGRVKPTMQAVGVSISDNSGLEREADLMGAKALQKMPVSQDRSNAGVSDTFSRSGTGQILREESMPVQRKKGRKKKTWEKPKKAADRVLELEKNVERLNKKQDCWNYLDLAQNKLNLARVKWTIASRDVGRAYENAYLTHQKAVKDAEKLEALKWAVAFAVLTAVTGGALGWVGDAVQEGKLWPRLKSVMAGGLEDAIQTGLGEGIDVIQQAVAPGGFLVTTSPYRFESDLLDTIDQQWKQVLEFFLKTKERLNKHSLADFDTVTPWRLEVELYLWLAGNKFMKAPTKQNVKDLTAEMERGMWAKWAPGMVKRTTWRRVYPQDPSVVMEIPGLEYTKPGRPVRDRFDELGITKSSGVGDFGLWTSSAEVDKVIAWAMSYTPRRFNF